MAKPKTLDQLRAEKERAEIQLAQEQHKLQRLENRKKYYEKGDRTKRTHRLCNLGGTIESLAPEVKDLTRTEMTELMEHIFSLSDGSPRIILKDGFNDIYSCLLDDDSRIQIVWGGRGSGKSNDVTRRIVASNYSGHNWLVCRYYKIDLRNSVYNQ